MDAKIMLDGVEYALVQPDDMTMREQRDFERIADAGVDRLANLPTDYRAALVIAWMAVSIRREKPQFPMDQILERLWQMKNAELAEAWQQIADQAEQSPPEHPPTKPASSGNEKPLSDASSNVSELHQDDGSRNATGSPHSELSSAANPAISRT